MVKNLKNLKNLIKKNLEIFGLAVLVVITAITTSYFNREKNLEKKAYNDLLNNLYLKKMLCIINS